MSVSKKEVSTRFSKVIENILTFTKRVLLISIVFTVHSRVTQLGGFNTNRSIFIAIKLITWTQMFWFG